MMMALLLFSCFLLSAIAIAQPKTGNSLEAPGGSDTWPMYRHDPEHSAFAASAAPDSAEIHWIYSTAGSFFCGSPAVADGQVFLGRYSSTYGYLAIALNAETGEMIWESPLDGRIDGYPAVVDGRVFYGTAGEEYTTRYGTIACLDAVTGTRYWSYNFGDDTSVSWPMVVDKLVYYRRHEIVDYGTYQTIRATIDCRQKNGSHLWSHSEIDARYLAPAILEDASVFVGVQNVTGVGQHVICLDALSGELVWESEVVRASSAPAVVEGRVIIGCSYIQEEIICLSAATGDVLWRNERPGSTAPALADDKVFIGSRETMVALEQSTGSLIWEMPLEQWIYASPVVADGKVYAGLSNGKVYCLDADDGQVIWTIVIGPMAYGSSPAIAGNRCYYPSTDLHTLYAIGESIAAPVNAELACLPDSGMLPLESKLWVTLESASTAGLRSIDGRFDLTLANGMMIPGWRSGRIQLAPGEVYSYSWIQTFPASSSLDGTNTVAFSVMDVTPPPYNLPPYQPAGASDTDDCTIDGYLLNSQ